MYESRKAICVDRGVDLSFEIDNGKSSSRYLVAVSDLEANNLKVCSFVCQ